MAENVTNVIYNVTRSAKSLESTTLPSISAIVNETFQVINNTIPNIASIETNQQIFTRKDEIRISSKQNDISQLEELWLWIFGIYCGNIALGVIFNGISLIALLRTKRNGTLSIIMQIISIDIVSSWVCVIELFSLKNNAWNFSPNLCPLFSGFETLCNTLTVYLIISLNYHTISLCNIKTAATNSCDASQECLVRDGSIPQNTTGANDSSSASIPSSTADCFSIETAKSSSSNGSSKNPVKLDISVCIPSILIWFTCLSLSIPQFTLSSTVENYLSENITCTCTLMDDSKLLINLLAIFRIFIPISLLAISVCGVIYKLVQHTRNNSIPTIFRKKSDNMVYYLIFCLVLDLLYIITSTQRLTIYALQVYTSPSLRPAKIYKLPPLFNDFILYSGFPGTWISLVLCMLHYSGTFLRFLIYVFLLPKFKSILCNTCLTCFKPNEA